MRVTTTAQIQQTAARLTSYGLSLVVLGVVFDVRVRAHDVGDFFLRTRRDGLIEFKLRDGGLFRAGGVLWRGMVRHGESFGRQQSTAYTGGGRASSYPLRTGDPPPAMTSNASLDDTMQWGRHWRTLSP